MKLNSNHYKIIELVLYLKDLNQKDPAECEKVIELMADYHIEANETEEEFWNAFLREWKKDMS